MNKLQSMYKSGGLLKALLKDPAQAKMAMQMLGKQAKAAKGMAVKKYQVGGQSGPPGKNTAARDELAAFKLQMDKKYGPDGKVSLEDATQYLTLQGRAEREQEYEIGQRREAIQEEIDSYNVPNEPTQQTRFNIGYDGKTYDTSRQRVKDNRMINNRAAEDQYFMQEVQGRSYAPGYFMPRTEMERTQKYWELHNAPRAAAEREAFMESLPRDVSRYDDYAGGGAVKYRAGGKAMYQNGGGPTGKKEGEYTRYATDIVPSRANFEEAIRQEFALGTGTMPGTAEELIALGTMDPSDLARVRSRAEQIASDDFNSRMKGARGMDRGHSRDIAAGMSPQEKEAYMRKMYTRPDSAEAKLRQEYGDRVIEQAFVTTDDPQGRYLQAEIDSYGEVQRIKKEREDAILREMGLL